MISKVLKRETPALVQGEKSEQKGTSVTSYISGKVSSLLSGKNDGVLLTEEDVRKGYIYINGKGKTKLSELAFKNGENILEHTIKKQFELILSKKGFSKKMKSGFWEFRKNEKKENNQFEFIPQKKD